MLTEIAGYYDHGQITLKEEPLVKTKTEVIVTFLHSLPQAYHSHLIGSKSYKIPKELKPLSTAIEESRYIITLEDGWNEENAKQIPTSLWENTVVFLIEYALHLYNHFDAVLEIPEINPVPNGTIDLSWRTKNARMLVNIREENNEALAYYYGDLYHDKFPVKGYVSTNNVTSHFMQWMKDYLAK